MTDIKLKTGSLRELIEAGVLSESTDGERLEALRGLVRDLTVALENRNRELRESTDYAEAVMAPARELLYLYDWRPDLAKAEKDPTTDPKWLKKMLREYGERKKAGWIALRAALNESPGGPTDGRGAPIAEAVGSSPTREAIHKGVAELVDASGLKPENAAGSSPAPLTTDSNAHTADGNGSSKFSDFIRNAEGEERAAVFERVIDKSIEAQREFEIRNPCPDCGKEMIRLGSDRGGQELTCGPCALASHRAAQTVPAVGIVQTDDAARWNHILDMVLEITKLDRAPTMLESALCWVVVKLREEDERRGPSQYSSPKDSARMEWLADHRVIVEDIGYRNIPIFTVQSSLTALRECIDAEMVPAQARVEEPKA